MLWGWFYKNHQELTSSVELWIKLNMRTLEHRHRINMICQVHRCLLNQAPSYLSSTFSANSSYGYTSTHGRSKIHLKDWNAQYRNFIDSLLNFMELNYTTTCQSVSGPSRPLGLFLQPWTNSDSSPEPTNCTYIYIYTYIYVYMCVSRAHKNSS